MANIPKFDPTDLANTRPLASVSPIRPDVSITSSAAQAKPGVLGKIGKAIGTVANIAFNTVETALNIVMSPITMIAFPAVVGAVNILGKEVEKAGNRFKLDGLSNAGAKARKVNEIKEMTFGEVVGGNRFSRFVAGVSHNVAGVAGSAAGKLADVIPLDKIREQRAGKFIKKAQGVLGEHETHNGAMPDELRKRAAEIIGRLKTEPGKITSEQLKEMNDGFAEAAKRAGIKRGTEAAAAVNLLKKAMSTAGKGINNLGKAQEWRTLGQSVKTLPHTIAKSNFTAGAVNTAFIAGSGLAMFGAAKGFAENLSSLKEMCSDITGKPVSTFQVLSGDVPKSISGARSQLLKSLVVSETTGAMNFGLAVKSAMNSKISPLSFVLLPVIGMGAEMLVGESVIPYYSALKDAHASGQKISPEAYAEFISKASPQLARSGKSSAFTTEMAKRYADANISPAQIIREISDGTLLKRVNSLIAESEAAKKTATAAASVSAPAVAAESAASPSSPSASHSHVASLKGERRNVPVVGDYTAAEAANRAQQASKTMAVTA